MEPTLRETIDHARRHITDTQWGHDFDDRYREYIKRCPECCAKAIDEQRAALRHEDTCPLMATLRELDALSIALTAKEDAGEDETLDPIEACSRTWALRMEALERELHAKAEAAEKRAAAAEARLRELTTAAREFGYADDRFRKILNTHGALR